MLRKYLIHKEREEPVAYLYYDEDTRLYSADILTINDKQDLPAMITLSIRVGKMHWDDKLARAYVKEHTIPNDRAGIDYILKELGFPYYDEIFFLDRFEGRSVMDDFLCTRVE